MTAPQSLPRTATSLPIKNGERGQTGADAPAHVTIRGLCKRFNDVVVYDRFDLDVPRGRLISVFGPNGCGKSTLIDLVAGLIPRDAGEILFGGKPLRDTKFG
jgi:NitT/TauT family transport system ATP-binding protein